jgi:DNA (cytosine-5)-methyltransferase 1
MRRCLELFAGGGGAAIGLEAAGLHHAALCEWDRDACATLRAAGLGPIVEGDVRDLDTIAAAVGPDPVDVLWSSFPCQAFSTAGKRLGAADERNGWPLTVGAIDRFRPAWLFGENVPGLLLHRAGCTYRAGQEGLFSAPDPAACPGCYFERVILPDLRVRFAHVGWWLLDAADFGVPQHRRRVILWAGPAPLTGPTPTHGPGRMRPWISAGEALGLGDSWGLQSGVCDSECRSRGAVRGCALPAPTVPSASRLYLAPPGGGGRRQLTIAESALLQGFPSNHPWRGGTIARYRQVGNALPPRIAEIVGRTLLAGQSATIAALCADGERLRAELASLHALVGEVPRALVARLPEVVSRLAEQAEAQTLPPECP